MWCHLVFLTPLFGLILFWVFPWPIAVGLYFNELWTAIADQPLPVGTSVRVIAVQGLVLYVAPEPNSELRA